MSVSNSTVAERTAPATQPTPFEIDALDDFAGTGWGVACQRLGIRERGVELMPEAVATRAANGMVTVGRDVWAHIKQQLAAQGTGEYYRYELYIGSPPCQTFSMAGGGKGRQALDEVIGLIDDRAYLDVDALHEFGEQHDPRTALVLAPLVRIAHDLPLYVVLEQVPPVLPVWERYAVELRKWGYSAWVGILNAEQYGVPQTRKRAILIARADGIEAAPPTPTHSRYYSHDPKRLDPGVQPWVSMAEALGWGMTARPYLTIAAGAATPDNKHTGGTDTSMTGGSAARERLAAEQREGRWLVGFPRKADGVGETVEIDGELYRARDLNDADTPAQVVTSKARSWERFEAEAVTFVNGNQPNAARRPGDTPAPTIHFGAKSNDVTWVEQSAHSQQNGVNQRPTTVPANTVASDVGGLRYIGEGEVSDRARALYADVAPGVQFVGHQYPDNKSPNKPNERQTRDADLPAPTVTSGSRSAEWQHERPATTVAGDSRVWPPGHKVNGSDRERLGEAEANERYGDRAGTHSTKVTVEEAAALQSYPATFNWSPMVPVMRNGVDTGRLAPLSKTKAFLQIGNAVPPTLAEAILSVFLPADTPGEGA